jgi:hypothetical protein
MAHQKQTMSRERAWEALVSAQREVAVAEEQRTKLANDLRSLDLKLAKARATVKDAQDHLAAAANKEAGV